MSMKSMKWKPTADLVHNVSSTSGAETHLSCGQEATLTLSRCLTVRNGEAVQLYQARESELKEGKTKREKMSSLFICVGYK